MTGDAYAALAHAATAGDPGGYSAAGAALDRASAAVDAAFAALRGLGYSVAIRWRVRLAANL